MALDSFPAWIAKVRKDPLGFAGYNRLLNRFRWAEAMLGREHLLAAGATVGVAGECNAAEVPREVGSVYPSAGPTYSKEGFRYATAASRPALGTAGLTLNAGVYPDVTQMSVLVQNCSEIGISKPCITSHAILTTGSLEFYSRQMTAALGAAQTWAVEDAPFVVAIHGPPLPTGTIATTGTGKVKGNRLTEAATDWDALVQSDADLRVKMLYAHTAAGVHNVREVARTFAHVGVRSGGGVYDALSTSGRNAISVSRPGLGICRLTNTTAWTLSAQPFVMPDYQRLNGGAESDIYVACTPRSLITTTTVDVYLYKYDPATTFWARADTDFWVSIHAG